MKALRAAAAAVAVAILGCLAVAACGDRAPAGAAGNPTPSAGPTPSAIPTTGPPAGFAYTDFSGGTAGAGSAAVTARIGSQDGYDRFVIEFAGTIPAYTLRRQPNSTFTQSPKGTPITLMGTGGVLLTLQPVAAWTAYSGPTALTQAAPYLLEARQVQNFEGVQQWGLGVRGVPALRVMTLSSPSRLVVDVAAP